VNAEPVTVRRLGIGLAVAVALLTSGCAAGQQAQTADQKAVEAGTEANAGNIALRTVLIESPVGRTPYYPVGSDASLRLVLVNSGVKADQLTGITSPAFTSWGAFATTADAAAVSEAANPQTSSAAASSSAPAAASSSAPASASSSTGSGAPATGASGSGAASSSAPATPSSTPTQLPTPSTSVALAAGTSVSWSVPDAKGALLLMHLKQRLYPGTTVQLTFTFAEAGTITVQVPIALSASAYSSVIPAPTSGGEG
jgi:copper(I)-binding protein